MKAMSLALLLCIFAGSVDARPHPRPAQPLNESNSYVNVDGNRVHDPVKASRAPSGATAQCRDGSYSFSQHHSGTCSHHGGVSVWL